MKLHYYPETDSLYISFLEGVAADTLEISDGLLADLDEDGRVIGLDIDNASQVTDLQSLEMVDLPAPAAL